MTKAHNVDAQRLSFILNELRLPAIKVIWPEFTERADKEGWPATRLLAALTEHEMAERDRRRIERHLSDARLPPGKTLDSFAFDGDCQDFRVWPGIMGNKESHYVTTQRTCHTE